MSLYPATNNITKADHARQLLRQRDWTMSELSKATGIGRGSLFHLIEKELKRGNVDFTGHTPCGKYRRFTWCGDDDLITTAIRVAEYLRAHAVDDLGKALAVQLMKLSDPPKKPIRGKQ